MKKIILAAAAVALTAGAAYAQPLNSNGERKSDYASILQAGGTTQAQGQQGLIDYTATASIGERHWSVNSTIFAPFSAASSASFSMANSYRRMSKMTKTSPLRTSSR